MPEMGSWEHLHLTGRSWNKNPWEEQEGGAKETEEKKKGLVLGKPTGKKHFN